MNKNIKLLLILSGVVVALFVSSSEHTPKMFVSIIALVMSGYVFFDLCRGLLKWSDGELSDEEAAENKIELRITITEEQVETTKNKS